MSIGNGIGIIGNTTASIDEGTTPPTGPNKIILYTGTSESFRQIEVAGENPIAASSPNSILTFRGFGLVKIETNPDTNEIAIGTEGSLTKDVLGLSNVNNTADADKPISSATQAALDTKVSSVVAGIAGATALTNIVRISQADYDALASHDPAVAYFII